MRLLFLVPLLVYGVGGLGIALGYLLGYWQLGVHPDPLLPFEAIGLTLCFVGWRFVR